MKTISPLFRRVLACWQCAALLSLAGGAAFSAQAEAAAYSSVNLDSDILGDAHDTDPVLINPWGLVTGTGGKLRVADEGTGLSTKYGRDGALLDFTGTTHAITIEQAAVTSGTTGTPTGVAEDKYSIVTSATNDFVITSTTNSDSSHYLYCTEDGAIEGYNRDVVPKSAVIGPNSADQSANDAGYTGIALSWAGTPTAGMPATATLAHQLYAANFRQGIVQVFDKTFSLVALTSPDTFTDPSPPPVPAGAPLGATWSPFNIHTLDYTGRGADGKMGTQRRLLVTYALHVSSTPLNDVPGAGFGFVDIFTSDGAFVERFVPPGAMLNSPWGIAVSHSPLPHLDYAPIVVLVGNHGDGLITTYGFYPFDASKDGKPLGKLLNDHGDPLAFDGLWTLHFGSKKITKEEYEANAADLTEDLDNLYFSAGIVGENHGLVGKILIPGFP